MVTLGLLKNRSDPSTYYSIDVYIIRNTHTFSNLSTIMISSVLYVKNAANFYYVNTINDASYSGIIDLDGFISYYIANNLEINSTVISDVRILGQITNGSGTVKIDYNAIYDWLVYMDPGVVGVVQGWQANL